MEGRVSGIIEGKYQLPHDYYLGITCDHEAGMIRAAALIL